MSVVVDVEFSVEEREKYLEEVREFLPAFLSEVASGRSSSIGDVSVLLGLESAQLKKVVAAHLALTKEILKFVEDLPDALRHPATDSARPPVQSQAIRGSIDWGATLRARSHQGADPTIYVSRPAERVFDTPENQALAWLLGELRRWIPTVKVAKADHRDRLSKASWYSDVLQIADTLESLGVPGWLRSVRPQLPNDMTIKRLTSSRKRFFAETLPEAISVFRRFTERPTAEDIAELICKRYFEPHLNWQLFEITIALRLLREIEQELGSQKSLRKLLVSKSSTNYASFQLEGGDEIKLWYQGWPTDVKTKSLVREARDRHLLGSGSNRPDFVLERRGSDPDAILLEVKASRSAYTLGQGLNQLVGYIYGRPDFWHKPTQGWLVAPVSEAFGPADAEGEPLWMVNADELAPAVVHRLIGSSEH